MEQINQAVRKMTERIAAILDGKVHSIWLYGSVVLDDFRPGWSDIDLLVLADGRITETQAEELVGLRQAMLEAEPGNPYYRAFEGIIADREEYLAGTFTRLVYWLRTMAHSRGVRILTTLFITPLLWNRLPRWLSYRSL